MNENVRAEPTPGNQMSAQQEGSAQPRRAAIIGFLLAGAILLGVSFFAQVLRNAPPVTAPVLRIVDSSQPADRGRLRFVTPAQLTATPMGWTAGDLHLHALVDTTLLMPGPAQLAHVAADTFAWTLPPMSPGTHVVQLFWADLSHRAAGDSVRLSIHVDAGAGPTGTAAPAGLHEGH
jgi:hypothetical protein